MSKPLIASANVMAGNVISPLHAAEWPNRVQSVNATKTGRLTIRFVDGSRSTVRPNERWLAWPADLDIPAYMAENFDMTLEHATTHYPN